MRARTILTVVGLGLLAAFLVLNLQAFTSPTTLSLGWRQVDAPLGLVMLGLLVGVVIAFMVSRVLTQGANQREMQNVARELKAQRDLADKAEASRFMELRRYLEQQAQTAEHLKANSMSISAHQLNKLRDDICARLDQTDNSLAASLGELQDRLERRN